MATIWICLVSMIGFDAQTYFSGTDFRAPFDFHSVYSVDTRDMSATVVWRADLRDNLIVECVTRAPKTYYLAFSAGSGQGLGIRQRDIVYIVTKSGVALRELTDVTTRFTWSPDGERLAYCPMDTYRRTPNGEIWILDVASGRKERTPETGYEVYWSSHRNKLLIWGDAGIYAWDVETHERSLTQLTAREISPTEQYCMDDCGDYFEVGKVCDLTTQKTIATMRGRVNDIPKWLNGHLLRTDRTHRNGVYDPRWYVLDCDRLLLYESRENVIAADEVDSLMAVTDGKIVRRTLKDLTAVPLDRLGVQLAVESRGEIKPTDGGTVAATSP